jgi:hypothetical protein
MAEDLSELSLAALLLALLASRGFPAVLVAVTLELDLVALNFCTKLRDRAIVVVAAPARIVVIIRERERRDRERSEGNSEDGDFLETEHD